MTRFADFIDFIGIGRTVSNTFAIVVHGIKTIGITLRTSSFINTACAILGTVITSEIFGECIFRAVLNALTSMVIPGAGVADGAVVARRAIQLARNAFSFTSVVSSWALDDTLTIQ